MFKTLKMFFDFCNKEDRDKLYLAITLGVIKAVFAALRIPAIAVVVQGLIEGELTMRHFWMSLGIMLISVLGQFLINLKTTMLQCEAGYHSCAHKRIEIAEHLRYLPMGFFNQNSLGVITNVTTNTHDFIMSLPDGYETVIGEGGASLSGGEKQRISIARAIMKDAPVIILDEATANVDPENESELTGAIEALTREKTIIMIAHRLKTVRHADRIYVIDNGTIAQQGTHEELLAQDGIYRNFVEGRQEAASWKLTASA